MSRLLEEDQVDHAIIHLNDLNMAIRRSMVPDGNPYWKADFTRAVAVADHLLNMYNNLSQRSNFIRKALKKETAKTMPVVVPEKPKRKHICLFFHFMIMLFFSGSKKNGRYKEWIVWYSFG